MGKKTYYQKNKSVILQRAKDYYENNQDELRERAKINTENYLEIKKMQRGSTKKTDIITCLMKKKTRIRRISKKLS